MNALKTKFVSVVIPILNEEDNIMPLYMKLKKDLDPTGMEYEIIMVDDGSSDKSFSVLKNLNGQDKKVKVIKFTKNFGQTSAMMAGIQLASAPVVVTMDGDQQNDSADIPILIGELEKGFDLVCGWRKDRQDVFWRRKVPSIFANKLISKFSGVHLHDYGCSLKAFKAKTIKAIRLYGELHRFIPALIAREGGKISEIVVRHHPRSQGISKYGMERVLKVLLDIFLLKFLSGYYTRPIHFFGKFGFMCFFLGAVFGFITIFQHYFTGLLLADLFPLVILSMLFLLFGMQSILIGLVAEISIRIYYETKEKAIYVVEQIIREES